MAPTTEGWSRWRLHPSVVREAVDLRTHRRLDHFTEIEKLGPTGLCGPSLRDPSNSRIMLDGAAPPTDADTAAHGRGRRGARYGVTALLGIVTASALVLAVVAVAVESPRRSLVVGGLLGYDVVLVALAVALVGVTCLAALGPRRWRGWAALPGLTMLPLGLVLQIVAPTTVAPLVVPNCVTPYVVDDTWGAGVVYRQDGLIAHGIASITTDDGYEPFHDGGYEAQKIGDKVQVRYFHSQPRQDSSLRGEPALTLPGEDIICE